MKVMQVIGGGEKGGSRSHIITLGKELRKKGVHVELVCFLDDVVAKSARDENIPVTVFPMQHIFDLRVIKQLHAYIKKKKPHLVHTHGVRANFIGRLAARRADTPVVTTVHSSIYHDYAHLLKKFFYHRIEKLTRPYTSKFIAVAGSLKKELEADGIKSEKIAVVYNGLSPDFPLDTKPAPFLRKELGIAEEIPVLMTIGRMESVKNQAMLLQVFALLKQNGIPFHGVLVGDGPLLSELKEMAASLEIEEEVSFLGFRKDIFPLLSEADLFLLTSKMEGLPVTLLEAMAASTPVVVTGVGGMPEIVQLAQNGYVVPVDDMEQFAARIQALLVQPDLKQKLAENGRQALRKHFTAEQFIKHTLQVYQEVLAEKSKAGKKEAGS
ncbi:MAG: glycosyltransferase family 4 protein [Peptococcaceae bacterium]|nr:glycosyltransferase family 4 protein [Peptococcaceae bacterium]